MKSCKFCKAVKPFSEFYKHHLARDGYDVKCKQCKVDVAREQRRQWKLQAIADKGGCCIKCGGEFPPYVFDFHHTDDNKEISPARAHSKAKFFREIEKCELVCSNCHRIIHHSF